MNYIIQLGMDTYEQVLQCECMNMGVMYGHVGKSQSLEIEGFAEHVGRSSHMLDKTFMSVEFWGSPVQHPLRYKTQERWQQYVGEASKRGWAFKNIAAWFLDNISATLLAFSLM